MVAEEPVPQPAPVREAATVVLLRDAPSGLETWLLRRVSRMAFAAGMSVFPGGAVDPDDSRPAAADPDGSDPTITAIATQLETTTVHASMLVRAAVRETFEEVGVLLTDPPFAVEPAVREAIERGEHSFAALLDAEASRPDLAAIRPWARWITPEAEVRRYDTYFFLAVLPPGARAASVTGEASHAAWIPIRQALAEYERDERPMLPPTVVTLSELSGFDTAAQALATAAARVVRPVRPTFGRDDHGRWCADLGDGRLVALPASFRTASGKSL